MAWTDKDEADLVAAEAQAARLTGKPVAGAFAPKGPNPELSLGASAMAGLKKLPGQVFDVGADVVKAAPGFAMDVAKQAYIARPFGDLEEQRKQNEAIGNVVGNIASGVKNVGMGLGQQAINQLPENMRFGNVDTSAAQGLEKAAYDRYGNWRNI
jgi:hypothetical protein